MIEAKQEDQRKKLAEEEKKKLKQAAEEQKLKVSEGMSNSKFLKEYIRVL